MDAPHDTPPDRVPPRALALSLAAALSAALTWSACLGTGVPLVLSRAGLDPAVAAGPLLIMLGDVSSAGLFVTAGHWIGGWLG